METLGRLVRIRDLRQYWPREDMDFTPWLAESENIEYLSEALGLDLEVQDTEVSAGSFKADILCKNLQDDSQVLIENQLEQTDHAHLGQLLTYAGSLNAVTLVWIVERFRDEHRAALDWLNRITDEGIRFFGLEIELWRIGDSAPAPKFNIAVKPNDWSKAVKEAAESQLTPGQRRQIEYWTSFAHYLGEQAAPFKPPKPAATSWINYGLGRSGVHLMVALKRNEAAVFIEVNNRDHPQWFARLLSEKDAIEKALGLALTWDERPGLKYANIGTSKAFDTTSVDSWPHIHHWMLENMKRFKAVMPGYVKRLPE